MERKGINEKMTEEKKTQQPLKDEKKINKYDKPRLETGLDI